MTDISIDLSLFLNNLNFPLSNFFETFLFCEIDFNILQGEKYGAVQTDSLISRDLSLLTIKLNCSDRIFPKDNLYKVALVSQDVQNYKRIH